jgi:sugar phosphate isomerase/epimerase
MVRTAVTIALVPEVRQGPFVFHGDLAGSIAKAAVLGFDAVEVFPPSGEAIGSSGLANLLGQHRLKLAALGTGAGWVVRKLTLTDRDAAARAKAIDFVRGIIDAAGRLGAPAIVGSMQGRHAEGRRAEALELLAEALLVLGQHAKDHGVPLLYEPLNRYETNLFNRQGEAAAFVRDRGIGNVKVLCDLFHMNIEEADVARALRDVGGDLLGHVHFVDSNRSAPGMGHTDFGPVVAALREIGYAGCVSAECFPTPDGDTAARRTIEAYRRMFPI